MQDLRLVGVHDDGEHVVLAAGDGTRYRLRVDEALRAAVRRDRARLGQLQIQMSAQLRPRDIQARIRAGESAEEVAEAGGLTLEHVRRYEGPVLAERAHVSGMARRAPYGRGAGAGSLEELVVSRLTARAVDPEGARWDAWREEDGAWTVQVEFVAGGRGRLARWAFDPSSKGLSASDDEARWLSEEEPAEPGPLPSRRLVSIVGDSARPVGERVYDVEADGGVRSAADRTDDLLDALDAQRGVRGPVPVPEDDEDADGGEVGTLRVDALLADPPPAHPAASAPHEHPDTTVLPAPASVPALPAEPAASSVEPAASGVEDAPGEVPDDVVADADHGVREAAAEVPGPVQDAPEEAPTDAPKPAPRKRNRSARRPGGTPAAGKRPSVPSWDEIMFGTKKD
ncbi:septation protein SepH [Kineococcus rubinsiae]|uniref:septation protein SepH n=1 Tax=Kineococcus rubinsiae TaxID=2609562 RepID=UPI00142F7202|nr:septation protein SepH [Kineococcus rubinsiae]